MESLTPHLVLEGEHDIADKEALASLLGSLRPDGPAVIDMTRVTYFDSTTLGELVKLRTRFKEHAIKLLVSSADIQRILQIVHFDELFEVVEA